MSTVAIPGPSDLPDLSSILSQISALPTGAPLPSDLDLSSIISQISALSTVAVPGPVSSSGLPDLSSVLSQISALPTSETLSPSVPSDSLLSQIGALPTTVSVPVSALPTGSDSALSFLS